jgi:predicted anti-sigma-YlaC factor YlaD
MTCDEIRRLIHEAHDDERAAALPDVVRAHLTACDACLSLKDDLESLRHALRSLPSIPLSGTALDEVWRATVRARYRPAPAARSTWRLAAAASFVSVLSAATLYFVLAPVPRHGPSAVELARASAQADIVFGYTAHALAAARTAATDRVLTSKVSPAVRGVATPHPARRRS